MRKTLLLGLALTTSLLFTAYGRNLALTGTATASSYCWAGTTAENAHRAIDGNTNGVFGNNSVTHTCDADVNSWWMVDLGDVKAVDSITVWNRADCCNTRMSNMRVSLLDASMNEVYGANIPNSNPVAAGGARSFGMPYGAAGRYVKISKLGADASGSYLISLAEVEVWGNDALVNVARNPAAVATQSSTNYSGPARLAIDGGTDGFFSNGSVTHTDDTATAPPPPVFWEVNLGGVYKLSEVDLFNRVDCCSTRLSNFRLSVYNGATEAYGVDVLTAVSRVGTYAFPTVEGDRVRIELINGTNSTGNNVIALAEAQVFGEAVPVLTKDLTPVTLFELGTLSMSVSAVGTLPLSYFWYHGTDLLPTQTTATLTIPNTAVADSGEYSVVVSNMTGTTPSSKVLVTVKPTEIPTITAQPQSITRYVNQTAVFTVTATGASSFTYQWQFEGSDLTGEKGQTLTIGNLQAAHAGKYRVIVTSSVGSTPSDEATLTIIEPVTGSYEAAVVASKPLAYYRFSDVATVQPAGGYAANRGTLGAAAQGGYNYGPNLRYQQPGAIAGSADTSLKILNSAFNTGLGDSFMDVPFRSELNPSGAFTVEFWFKNDSVITDSPGLSPVGSIDFIRNRAGWLFYVGAGSGGANKVDFRLGNAGSTTYPTNIVSGLLPVGQWYHVVGIYDGANISLYTNGALAAGPAAVSLFNPNLGAPLRVGCTTSPNRQFDGAVDEVAFYNGALPVDRILAHYQNGIDAGRTTPYDETVLADSPLGYWQLNEAAPASALPQGTAANEGTQGPAANGGYRFALGIPATGPAVPPFVGFEAGNPAIYDNGLNGQAAAVMPALNLYTNAVTITAWAKRNGTQADWAGLVFCRGGSTVAGLDMGTAGDLRYHWNDTAASYNFRSGLTLPDGKWAFAALVVEPSKATFYMHDGTSLKSATNTTSHAIEEFNASLNIGLDNGTRSYRGGVDEVAVYNRALSGQELFDLAAAGFPTPPVIVKDLPSTVGVYDGGTLSLSITASGTPPLMYQWWYFDFPLDGETSSTLTVPNFSGDANSGQYYCTVSNILDGVMVGVKSTPCDVVGLVEDNPPTIDSGPTPRYLARAAGSSATFSVVASGGLRLHYQWQHDGSDLKDQTNSTLTIAGLTASDAGQYKVLVSNRAGTTPSDEATLVVVEPSTTTYSGKVLALGPIAYWQMNEPNGPIAYDLLGLHDATAVGPVLWGASGPQAPNFPGMPADNTSVLMDGASTMLGTGSSFLNNLPAFTLMAWINPSAALGGRIAIVGQNDCLEFGTHDSGQIGVWSPSGAFTEVTYPFPPNEWHFVAAVGDGATVKIYFDGNQASSAELATSSYGSSAEPVNIGAAVLDATGNYFPGMMDDVAIFNKALTAKELCDLFVTAIGSGDLKMERAPLFTRDTKPSGSPHNGAIRDATWAATDMDAASVSRSGVMLFDATQASQVTIPANGDFDTSVGTIMFWMRSAGTTGSGSEGAMLVDRRPGTGDVIVFFDDGSIFIQPEWMYGQSTTAKVNDNKWHHVAYVYDQSAAGSITVYIDGLADFNKPNPRAWTWGSQQVELGRSHDGYWKYFNGAMADFRMYNKALSAAEVAQVVAGDDLAVVAPTEMTVRLFNAPPHGLRLTWPCGALWQADSVIGPWTSVPSAVPPYAVDETTAPVRFYQLR